MPLVDAKGNQIPEELHKIKIHAIEIPLPTNDAEKLFKGCRIPVYGQLELAPGQRVGFVAGHEPGMNAAEALLALETANAIEALKNEIASLKEEINELKKHKDA